MEAASALVSRSCEFAGGVHCDVTKTGNSIVIEASRNLYIFLFVLLKFILDSYIIC